MSQNQVAAKKQVLKRGLVHAYIGYGKGKTTAAIGVAVRARGYGMKVLFLQFMKSEDWPSGERNVLKKIGVDVRVMGAGFYRIMGDKKSAQTHKSAALKALRVAEKNIFSGKYQLVVLDELGTAVEEGLLPVSRAEKIFAKLSKKNLAVKTHVIWTGHKKIAPLMKYADLITEMKPIRHPFTKGMLAVQGIDY